MNRARRWPLVVGRWREARRTGAGVCHAFVCGRQCAWDSGAQGVEQELLLAGEEAQLEPAENVVHDRLGESDLGSAAPAAGFEAGVSELFAEKFQRHAVLQ